MNTILSTFSFYGRMRRTAYGLFVLMILPTIVVVSVLFLIFLLRVSPNNILEQIQQSDPRAAHVFDPLLKLPALVAKVGVIASAVIIQGLYVAWIASSVRRLHDMNVSGWAVLVLMLFAFIPYVGYILVGLFLTCWPAAKGANRFGPDPRLRREIEGLIACGT